jgi:hypothetical protein
LQLSSHTSHGLCIEQLGAELSMTLQRGELNGAVEYEINIMDHSIDNDEYHSDCILTVGMTLFGPVEAYLDHDYNLRSIEFYFDAIQIMKLLLYGSIDFNHHPNVCSHDQAIPSNHYSQPINIHSNHQIHIKILWNRQEIMDYHHIKAVETDLNVISLYPLHYDKFRWKVFVPLGWELKQCVLTIAVFQQQFYVGGIELTDDQLVAYLQQYQSISNRSHNIPLYDENLSQRNELKLTRSNSNIGRSHELIMNSRDIGNVTLICSDCYLSQSSSLSTIIMTNSNPNHYPYDYTNDSIHFSSPLLYIESSLGPHTISWQCQFNTSFRYNFDKEFIFPKISKEVSFISRQKKSMKKLISMSSFELKINLNSKLSVNSKLSSSIDDNRICWRGNMRPKAILGKRINM